MSELLDVSTEPTKTAQTGAPETEPTGWMPLTDELRQSAPENVRKLLETTKWNTVEDMAKGYSELQKFTGVGKHLVIPQDDNPESWNNVWNQLGRPETPDQYVLDVPEDAVDPELTAKWKKFAHEQGYTQKQMESAVQFQLDIISEVNRIENEKREAYKAELVKKYGGEAQLNSKLIEMKMVAEKLGIYQTLEQKGLASDPQIIEMLDKIASGTAEGVIAPPSPPVPTKSPQEELEEIKKSEAFTRKFHPQHKEIIKRFMELNQIIANSGQAPKRYNGG